MLNLRMLKVSDLPLWIAVGALVLIGFLSIFSSTYALQSKAGLDAFLFFKRQFISFFIGLVGLSIFAYFDYGRLKNAAPYFYALAIVMLAAILFSGSGAQGAQRWFQLGPLTFQPSEISKLVMIITLAVFINGRKKLSNLWEAGYLLAMAGLPFLLIFKQPDLGTALGFLAILIRMLAISEASPTLLILLATPILSILMRPLLYLWLIYLIAMVLTLFLTRASAWNWVLILGTNISIGIAVPYIWGMLKGYQRMRIIAFLNPAADPYGAGYHSLQSKIAIGSGGLIGKGFLQGTQTQLQFIPEQHSDFIFSAVGEEFGFIGALIVIALFAIVIWRTLVIAFGARDFFGTLLASGIAVMTAFHALANIGMALGLLPVVGIPLPFMSYGGSSLLMNLICLGILQNIAMRRQKLIF